MKTFNIAVIAADGIGKEVVPKAFAYWKRPESDLVFSLAGALLSGLNRREVRKKGLTLDYTLGCSLQKGAWGCKLAS